MPTFTKREYPACPNCGFVNGELKLVRNERGNEEYRCFECASNVSGFDRKPYRPVRPSRIDPQIDRIRTMADRAMARVQTN